MFLRRMNYNRCEDEIMNYVKINKTMKNAGGISIPDFFRKIK